MTLRCFSKALRYSSICGFSWSELNLLDSSTMIQLAGYLLRDIFNTSTAQQTWEYIQKTFTSAYDSIISCIWIPVDLATASAKATLAPLKIGKDEVNISGVVVNAYKVNNKTPIDISNVFVTFLDDTVIDLANNTFHIHSIVFTIFFGIINICFRTCYHHFCKII